MPASEPVPGQHWGGPPQPGLTASRWRICTCQAGTGSLGSQMGVGGWLGAGVARRQRPPAESVFTHGVFLGWSRGSCDGERQAWAEEGRGCEPEKTHSKSQAPPLPSSPSLAPEKGKAGSGSRW